ncbi:MAG: GNAT family N-acetyltransferase [Acidobacteriota bacterium]|jgi:ribosomal-protein-alanine acetyltransferase
MMLPSHATPIRIERLNLPPSRDHLAPDPETTALITRIVALEIASGLSTRGEQSYYSIANEPAHLILLARSGRSESDLVGVFAACIVLDELQIDNLAVRADQRGQGIGSLLVANGLTRARQAGCQMAILEVRSANRAARMLYQKSGFEEVGKRPRYYQNPPDDAITMICQL